MNDKWLAILHAAVFLVAIVAVEATAPHLIGLVVGAGVGLGGYWGDRIRRRRGARRGKSAEIG